MRRRAMVALNYIAKSTINVISMKDMVTCKRVVVNESKRKIREKEKETQILM